MTTEKASRATFLCQRLHRAGWKEALAELTRLYLNVLFYVDDTTPGLGMGLSLVYVPSYQPLDKAEVPSLPNALRFHALWIGRLSLDEGPTSRGQREDCFNTNGLRPTVLWIEKSKLIEVSAEANLRHFQVMRGIPADGVFGVDTRVELQRLYDRLAPKPTVRLTRWDRLLSDDLDE